MQHRVPAWETKASKPLAVKTCGSCSGGRNSQFHRRVCRRDPQGPRMYTSPPTQESAPEGPNLFEGTTGHDWKWGDRRENSIVPSPTYSTTTHRYGLPFPGEYLRLRPLQRSRCTKTKNYGPNERTDQSSRKRTKQRGYSNLSDAEFKAL